MWSLVQKQRSLHRWGATLTLKGTDNYPIILSTLNIDIRNVHLMIYKPKNNELNSVKQNLHTWLVERGPRPMM